VVYAKHSWSEAMTIKVFESNPSYDQWCEANGFDPDDDETYNAYCEWRSNNR